MNKVIFKTCILPQDNGHVPSIHMYNIYKQLYIEANAGTGFTYI